MCRELGYTLSELREKETHANLQIWYALRLIEIDERKQAELKQDALDGLAKNKGRFTHGL